VTNRLRLAILVAALALGACTQTVMVTPANQDSGPPPVRPHSKSSAPTYVVQQGDTLYKISMQYGVDYRELASWNAIAAPYTIYPKQTLRVGPEAAAAASSTVASTSTAEVAPPPAGTAVGATAQTQVVSDQPATTAAQTSKPEAYDPNLGVTLPAGAEPIGTPTAASMTGSAAVFEPVATAAAAPASASGAVSAATDSATAATVESMPTAVAPKADTIAPLATGAATPAATTAAASTSAASIVTAKPSAAGWIWPATGKVVVTYASGDPTRQGIDIAGEIGQDVRAARDGEVVYSGAGLIGYGELVIIKHSPELLSAYGHNRVRLVKEGDKVKSGQKIAEMGKNSANRVLLHFEVRKNGKPVDPLPLLPAR
jgi:lipoprotein NlpD